jgi:hypothetical protein
MGIRTLRLVNAGNRNDTSWLDTTTETQADYHCSTRDQMRQVLEEALMGPNKGNAIAG